MAAQLPAIKDDFSNLSFKELSEYKDQTLQGLGQFVEEHKDPASGQWKMTQAELKEFNKVHDHLGDVTKSWEELRLMDERFQKVQEEMRSNLSVSRPAFPSNPGQQRNEPTVTKSVGQLFTESQTYKQMEGNHPPIAQYTVKLDDAAFFNGPDSETKTTITTAAGFAPRYGRIDRVVETALRRPMIADLMPNTNTTASTIIYMEETTFTNNAATVAENAAKPESALAWTERSRNVNVIATYVPVTRQQLDDVPQIRSVIDNRLRLMLALAEEAQLLSGSGTDPQLLGFYNLPSIQTQAKGSDPTPDAIYKAFTKVRWTGFAEPTGVVMHPNDWQDVRLLRTTDGMYIWGNPSEAGPERIWGKPVVVTSAATENTGLTGDFQLYSELFRRMGVTIITGLVNDDLIKNKQTILAEERAALIVYRQTAFCTITGI